MSVDAGAEAKLIVTWLTVFLVTSAKTVSLFVRSYICTITSLVLKPCVNGKSVSDPSPIVNAFVLFSTTCIFLYVEPSSVICHILLASFHLNATFVSPPLSTSIPAFSVAVEPVKLLFKVWFWTRYRCSHYVN